MYWCVLFFISCWCRCRINLDIPWIYSTISAKFLHTQIFQSYILWILYCEKHERVYIPDFSYWKYVSARVCFVLLDFLPTSDWLVIKFNSIVYQCKKNVFWYLLNNTGVIYTNRIKMFVFVQKLVLNLQLIIRKRNFCQIDLWIPRKIWKVKLEILEAIIWK